MDGDFDLTVTANVSYFVPPPPRPASPGPVEAPVGLESFRPVNSTNLPRAADLIRQIEHAANASIDSCVFIPAKKWDDNNAFWEHTLNKQSYDTQAEKQKIYDRLKSYYEEHYGDNILEKRRLALQEELMKKAPAGANIGTVLAMKEQEEKYKSQIEQFEFRFKETQEKHKQKEEEHRMQLRTIKSQLTQAKIAREQAEDAQQKAAAGLEKMKRENRDLIEEVGRLKGINACLANLQQSISAHSHPGNSITPEQHPVSSSAPQQTQHTRDPRPRTMSIRQPSASHEPPPAETLQGYGGLPIFKDDIAPSSGAPIPPQPRSGGLPLFKEDVHVRQEDSSIGFVLGAQPQTNTGPPLSSGTEAAETSSGVTPAGFGGTSAENAGGSFRFRDCPGSRPNPSGLTRSKNDPPARASPGSPIFKDSSPNAPAGGQTAAFNSGTPAQSSLQKSAANCLSRFSGGRPSVQKPFPQTPSWRGTRLPESTNTPVSSIPSGSKGMGHKDPGSQMRGAQVEPGTMSGFPRPDSPPSQGPPVGAPTKPFQIGGVSPIPQGPRNPGGVQFRIPAHGRKHQRQISPEASEDEQDYEKEHRLLKDIWLPLTDLNDMIRIIIDNSKHGKRVLNITYWGSNADAIEQVYTTLAGRLKSLRIVVPDTVQAEWVHPSEAWMYYRFFNLKKYQGHSENFHFSVRWAEDAVRPIEEDLATFIKGHYRTPSLEISSSGFYDTMTCESMDDWVRKRIGGAQLRRPCKSVLDMGGTRRIFLMDLEHSRVIWNAIVDKHPNYRIQYEADEFLCRGNPEEYLYPKVKLPSHKKSRR